MVLRYRVGCRHDSRMRIAEILEITATHVEHPCNWRMASPTGYQGLCNRVVDGEVSDIFDPSMSFHVGLGTGAGNGSLLLTADHVPWGLALSVEK
jgi:hypothetical protein